MSVSFLPCSSAKSIANASGPVFSVAVSAPDESAARCAAVSEDVRTEGASAAGGAPAESGKRSKRGSFCAGLPYRMHT